MEIPKTTDEYVIRECIRLQEEVEELTAQNFDLIRKINELEDCIATIKMYSDIKHFEATEYYPAHDSLIFESINNYGRDAVNFEEVRKIFKEVES